MKTRKYALIFFLFLFAFNNTAYCQSTIEKVVPENWLIKKYISIPQKELPFFSKKFGGEIVSIENYIFAVEKIPLQINIIECSSDSDAQNVYHTLVTLQKTDENYLLKNNAVYEFMSKNSFIMKKAKSLFQTNMDIVTWNVTFDIAPITSSDDMEFNNLFNLLHEYTNDKSNTEIEQKIIQKSRFFTFTDIVMFNNKSIGGIKPKYKINADTIANSRNDLITFRVVDPPLELNIPKLHVVASIPVQGFTNYLANYDIDVAFYTMSNTYWPSDNPELISILKEILRENDADIQKLEAIQQWVYNNIKYAGVTGSRYGTMQVLHQKYGRCWDKCDVLVTLCRAAHLPARQIAGWIREMSGHVWAEVYIQDQGWISVDATTPFLGISDDYVPLFIIETGKIPAVELTPIKWTHMWILSYRISGCYT